MVETRAAGATGDASVVGVLKLERDRKYKGELGLLLGWTLVSAGIDSKKRRWIAIKT